MSKTKVRIKLKSFEHKNLDTACAKIVETVKRTGGFYMIFSPCTTLV